MRSAANQCLTFNTAQEYTPLQETQSLLLLRALIDGKGEVDLPVRRWRSPVEFLRGDNLISFQERCSLDHEGRIQLQRKRCTWSHSYSDRELCRPYAECCLAWQVRFCDIYIFFSNQCFPGSYIVDILPFLNRLPAWAASWKREGQKWYQKDTARFIDLVDNVKAGLVRASSRFVTLKPWIESIVSGLWCNTTGLSGWQTSWNWTAWKGWDGMGRRNNVVCIPLNITNFSLFTPTGFSGAGAEAVSSTFT